MRVGFCQGARELCQGHGGTPDCFQARLSFASVSCVRQLREGALDSVAREGRLLPRLGQPSALSTQNTTEFQISVPGDSRREPANQKTCLECFLGARSVRNVSATFVLVGKVVRYFDFGK